MAALINKTEAGEMDASTLSKLSYAVNILAGIIQNSDIEARIAKLEQEIDKR